MHVYRKKMCAKKNTNHSLNVFMKYISGTKNRTVSMIAGAAKCNGQDAGLAIWQVWFDSRGI